MGCASSHTGAGDGNNSSIVTGLLLLSNQAKSQAAARDYFLGMPCACARKFMMEPCTLWPMVMTGSQRSSL